MATCRFYVTARAKQHEATAVQHKRKQQDAIQTQGTPVDPPAPHASSAVTEFAGNASTCLPDPSDPSFPLQLNADYDWLPDTGATSHMTPHRHWLRNYKPLRIPVRLADHSIVYTAGVGSVVFDPVVNGKPQRSVEWTRVLHVPGLRSNLLSCLYLTRVKEFTMVVNASQFRFIRSNQCLFTATITPSNSAALDGTTVAPEQGHWHQAKLSYKA